MEQDIRWVQRLQNFSRAFILLQSAFEEQEQFTRLEEEGLIKRFEVAFELAWKTLKDYLEYTGLSIPEATPRRVIQEATTAKVLERAEVQPNMLIDMLLARNLLSHTYDFERFQVVLHSIKAEYLAQLNNLYIFFLERENEIE
ncbi:nucleotidyltransferase substrate binding protein [Deferribacterales bacterium RsTz2092]